MERVALGDIAGKKAVTGVNAEKASKREMWEPTQLRDGEGRRHGFLLGERHHPFPWSHRGNGDGMSVQGDRAQHGKPQRWETSPNRKPARDRSGRVGWRTGS